MRAFIPGDILIQQLRHPLAEEKKIIISMARLDLLHPIVSGNKIFKLRYFLQEAISSGKDVLTYGGAYSNHLLATAYACKQAGINCKGMVRGEKPVKLSDTLQHCLHYGMKLEFLSREDYKKSAGEEDKNINAEFIEIPEGGFSSKGAKGAATILPYLLKANPSHICTAVGTATTLAGLIMNNCNLKTIAVPVLKNMQDIHERVSRLTGSVSVPHLDIWTDYHFSGYAKHNKDLINFMNEFYLAHHIALDFVYTAKLMNGVMDKLKNNYFTEGDHIVCLHTGGLQGNHSLPAGSLCF